VEHHTDQQTDEQLVMLCLQGQTAAFEILVSRYQRQVFSLAYRLGGDYDEARDMAQEVFIRIYQELPRFDKSRKFFPWMYRVAHNTCVNALMKRPKETVPLDNLIELHPREISATAAPDSLYESSEIKQTLTTALRELPEQYRLPLFLKYIEGLSYQEICSTLNLPQTTVETRLFRGRKILRKILEEHNLKV